MKKHEMITIFTKSNMEIFFSAKSFISPKIEETQVVYKNVLQLVNEML